MPMHNACQMQPQMQTVVVPEKYFGPISICLFCLCWPTILCTYSNPCDTRMVTKVVTPGGLVNMV